MNAKFLGLGRSDNSHTLLLQMSDRPTEDNLNSLIEILRNWNLSCPEILDNLQEPDNPSVITTEKCHVTKNLAHIEDDYLTVTYMYAYERALDKFRAPCNLHKYLTEARERQRERQREK